MSVKKKADLKVIILGDHSVGKTSLLRRYIDGKFKEHEKRTVGAAFYLKQWGPYNVAFWDTAGEEKYTGLSHFYCRSAGAAILAFDLTDESTYESICTRFSNILEAANEDCIKIIVGTKSDLIDNDNRQVTFEEGRQLSREMNSMIDMNNLPHDPYFETSSLLNENVSELFDYILQYCLPLSPDQKKKQIKKSSRHGEVELMEKSCEQSNSKKRCCSLS